MQPARDKVIGHSIQTKGAKEAPTKPINCCQTTGTEEIDMGKGGRGEKERGNSCNDGTMRQALSFSELEASYFSACTSTLQRIV